ncbi:hypothetical protein [Winogradskyella costae]|uniref:hypothetical protein n=1 Tax=Winogradskyella costae TaxID=2697008 RepID=UPI0015CADC06|nr:hypothetical protein [Winogradskyella costae]
MLLIAVIASAFLLAHSYLWWFWFLSLLQFIDIIKTDIKTVNMDILSFLGGNGLFLILGVVLIIVYFYNRNKRR